MAADFVFTSDSACVEKYHARLGHDRVHWLPLACAPEIHHPLPLDDGATDFVLSANWYRSEARLWAVQALVDPIITAGYGLTLFCYENFLWPERYARFWRGETHYLTTGEQYRHGRAVLGLNNQRSGMDGLGKTCMTSMRTFEALACGKPFLASHSDAYEQLGFINGEHLAWTSDPAETLDWAARVLGPDGLRMARAGRDFVLAHHTYAHWLRRIIDVFLGLKKSDPGGSHRVRVSQCLQICAGNGSRRANRSRSTPYFFSSLPRRLRSFPERRAARLTLPCVRASSAMM
jgi:spore maturation protein CgeB